MTLVIGYKLADVLKEFTSRLISNLIGIGV